MFKRGKYQDIILLLTVLRRLDCVLAPTKEEVLRVNEQFKDKLVNLDVLLRKASGFAFYNTSRYDFEKLLADALIAKVKKAIELLKEYRTALIFVAVTGKIDVREEVTA